MATISHPLDFERPLVELEVQLEALRDQIASGAVLRQDEYAKLEAKAIKVRRELYGRLTRYQRVQLSRHFDRPYTMDYIKVFVEDFVEFHGDRLFRDDPAIVGGTGRVGGKAVMIVGHQRGRTTAERLQRNFGMAHPEGYRKALRLFKMSERFSLPVITFIDTQGAYPGMGAEERGQAEAIARNLAEMAETRTPILCVIIGEGGSGGALALGVGDKVLMLENACYSVITPEGCAAILWGKEQSGKEQSGKEQSDCAAKQAAVAAEALQITAQDLKRLGVIDEIIPEPIGGAHWNPKEAGENLKAALVRNLEELASLAKDDLLDRRYRKFRAMGVFTDQP
jgi:acetyl-CoA carboxylase carboxyl transferase subunit alpha